MRKAPRSTNAPGGMYTLRRPAATPAVLIRIPLVDLIAIVVAALWVGAYAGMVLDAYQR